MSKMQIQIQRLPLKRDILKFEVTPKQGIKRPTSYWKLIFSLNFKSRLLVL